jgi:hypothetical protein
MFILLRQGFGGRVVGRMSPFNGLTALSEAEGLCRINF